MRKDRLALEVRVFGAGVFGLAVAYACVLRGARVEVVDPAGVAAGASGGVVGALAPHAPERWNALKSFQFAALQHAPDFWAGVQTRSGINPGYARTGRLQPVADTAGRDRAEALGCAAAQLWRNEATWRLEAAAEVGDWAPRSPSGWLVRDTLSARLHPRRACQALAAAIAALGGSIRTEPSELPATAVVEATGHAGLAARRVVDGRPLGSGVKGQAALLACDRPEAPQIYADRLHIVPHDDGTVAVGSTSEADFDNPDTTDAALAEVIARAGAVCPPLAAAPVVARWAGVRPRSRTRQPVLGPLPGHPGRYIANGGFKIGFGLAPQVGTVMADLVLEGRDTGIPPEFRLDGSD